MTFEEKLYHAAAERSNAAAKALAHFMFREIVENIHSKYNISQEEMCKMNKQAVNRAALFFSLSESEKEAFKIEAICAENWDDPEETNDVIAHKELYESLSKLIK
mgnify:CR=1 FL=1